MHPLSALLSRPAHRARSAKQRVFERRERQAAKNHKVFEQLAEARRNHALEAHVEQRTAPLPQQTTAETLLGEALSPAQQLLDKCFI